MENLFYAITLLSSIGALAVLCIYHLHMFQLNSYKIEEEFTWIRKNRGSLLGRVLGLIFAIIFLFFGKMGVFLALLLNLITIYGNRPQEAKIKLVYTNRIWRLIITAICLYLIILSAINMVTKNSGYLIMVTCFLAILAPAVILAANFINHPLETYINHNYIKDAKKRLQSMPNLVVIGITGSYGKTSMKYYLNNLLLAKYNVLITPGNFNTTLGVVRTIREQLRATHQIFLCEMGAKTTGEIMEICNLVNPQYGVITSIGPQHLESFKSLDNIISTKFELADAIPDKGLVFLNIDNGYIRERKINKPIITYGLENINASFCPFDVTTSKNGSQFKLQFPDGSIKNFTTKLIGEHNVLNIAGAIAVAYYMGVTPDLLVQQVRGLKSVPHRLELIRSPRGIIIDDAYNSNPAGAQAALKTLGCFDGVKILITPGMIEMGEKQYEYNKVLGQQAAEVADYIILVGRKQTLPIKEGILEKGFPENRLLIVDSIEEGISRADGINTGSREKIILFENDLPDNY